MSKLFAALLLSLKKLSFFYLVSIAVVLIILGNLAWLLPTLNVLEKNALTLHRTIALDALNQISSFLDTQEETIQNAVDIINRQVTSPDEVISRLLKENQAFESLTIIGVDNKEVFKSDRYQAITINDLKDRSNDPLIQQIDQNKIYRGQVTIAGSGTQQFDTNPTVRTASEAVITIALPIDPSTGYKALVADVNMKFFSNVVRGITVGKVGVAYLVDQNGFVIAHPDSSIVLKRTNYKARSIIQSALNGKEASTVQSENQYRSENNVEMFAVALPVKSTSWAVVVEEPRKDALAALNQIFEVALISFTLEAILVTLLIWNYFNLVTTSNVTAAERNKLLVVLSSMSDAVIAVDLNSNIVIFNRAAKHLTGFDETEVLGKPINNLMKILDQGRELSVQEYTRYRSDGYEGITFDKRNLVLIARNNKQSQINLITSQISEGRSTNLGSILTLHDVTAEVQLEKMKLDFVSIAAHELRTPLTVIQGYLQVFFDEGKGKFSPEQMMFLDRINISTRKLSELIENLLNVSQIERHALTFKPESMDWVHNIESVITDFQNNALQKRIALNFIRPLSEVPKIYTDKLRINEALSNLIGNALNYTPTGGVVKVWIDVTDTDVITHIQDTGPGIPPEALPHLFTKFFRVQGALERGSKGTGLGLYISKAIIEMHHGRIWANSEVGRGSTFSFALPIHSVLPASQTLISQTAQIPV